MSESDTEAYYMSTVQGGRLVSEQGGTLELDPDKPMAVPGTLQATTYGMAFGPLEISAYPGSTARIGGLRFDKPAGVLSGLFGDGSSGGGLFATAVLASHRDEEIGATRRDLLRVLAASGLFVGGTAAKARAATGTTKKRTRAQFAVLENPAGIRLRVFDRVPHVMPASKLYYTYVNGQQYASFTAANESDYGDVLPKATGTVTIGPEGSGGGFFAGLGANKTQTYDGLPLKDDDGSGISTSEASVGEELTITTNDIITEHVQSAGASNATLAIAGTSIPHEHETANSPLGYYGIHNGALIYRVGSNAPSGQTATLVLYADTTTELMDDIERQVN